ncbi:MAG: thioredoxin [Cytophagaceae bacterium]|nr:thioredoxin [Gemmatimonadaceae bacterium]
MNHEINQGRRRFVAAAALTGLELAMYRDTRSAVAVPTTAGDGLAALRGATTWLNSAPLTAAGLRGKVVLIDVGTYTCINWLRTLPYRRAWAEKYRESGLVLVGVHTPEFQFEHDLDNVRRALGDMKVLHPIAVDNDYAIWNGLDNRYWPALYLFDATGKLRHEKFGEGDYERSEAAIQQVVTERGARAFERRPVTVEGRGIEAPADWATLGSPETYLGFARAERFASKERPVANLPRVYTAPARLRANEWALAGTWGLGKQAARSGAPDARIVYRFRARDVHLVMGPAAHGMSVRFRVRVDGLPPGAASGGDVDEAGNGVLDQQRLYQLIRQSGQVVERSFEIEFLDQGAEAFAFTFG